MSKNMSTSFCKKCKKQFTYDLEQGVNVKYYESSFDALSFTGSGVFPICPVCENQCELQTTYTAIKMETKVIPVKS